MSVENKFWNSLNGRRGKAGYVGYKRLFQWLKVYQGLAWFFPVKKLVECSAVSIPVSHGSLWLCEGWEVNFLKDSERIVGFFWICWGFFLSVSFLFCFIWTFLSTLDYLKCSNYCQHLNIASSNFFIAKKKMEVHRQHVNFFVCYSLRRKAEIVRCLF